MKKLLALLLILVLCFAAAGCGKTECGHEQYEQILNALDRGDYSAAKAAIDALASENKTEAVAPKESEPVAEAPDDEPAPTTEDPSRLILQEAQELLAEYEKSIARYEENDWYYYDKDKAQRIYDLFASVEGAENPFVKLESKLTLASGETEDNLGNVSSYYYKPFYRYDTQGRVIATNDTEYGYYFGYDVTRLSEMNLVYGEGDRVEQVLVLGAHEVIAKITPHYDESGLMTGCDIVTNKGSFSVSFTYTNGLRTKTEYLLNEDGEKGTYTYTYDAEGRRTSWHYFVGNGRYDFNFDITYSYDAEGHLTESVKKGKDWKGNYTQVTTYETDAQGRILSSVTTTDSTYEVYNRRTFVYTYEDVYVYCG